MQIFLEIFGYIRHNNAGLALGLEPPGRDHREGGGRLAGRRDLTGRPEDTRERRMLSNGTLQS